MVRSFLFLIFWLISEMIFSQSTPYDQVLDSFVSRHAFSGVVLVGTAGKTDWTAATGFSNREKKIVIDARTRFKIASVTKTFTAVLIMQLVEAGKLDLHKTIGAYLPGYHGAARDSVTLLQLLTYSSGIPNCENGRGMEVYQSAISPDDFIARYCSGALESSPGTRFSYDNGDYIILGRILEKVTGKAFGDLLKQKILLPLGMKETGLARSDETQGLAANYTYDDSTARLAPDAAYRIENFFSAGAMYSTVPDLYLFDQGIFTYRLLKKKTVDEMLIPHKELNGVGIGFWQSDGYGKLDSPFVYRPGGILGATANWIHFTGSNKAIIVLSNTSATNLFGLSADLYTAGKKPASE